MTPQFLETIIMLQIIQFLLAVLVFVWIAYKWLKLEILIRENLKK
jgi:hypothetical protein